MPKQHKKGGGDDGGKSKGKVNKGDVATAKADDDFDNMLADFRASDILNATTTNTTRTTGSSSSSTSSSSSVRGSSSSTPGTEVTEAMIVQASIRSDVTQLLRWAKRGVRVSSAEALRRAVLKNKISAVRWLARLAKELRADVNQVSESDFTPLLIAAEDGNVEMVKCLVKELGADVHQASEKGFCALHIAAAVGSLAVMRCLVGGLGAGVNQEDVKGVTPLHYAALTGNLKLVQCLVKELGAGVNQGDGMGLTPLYSAAQNGHLAVVRYLVKDFAADVNLATMDGSTLLMKATERMHYTVVRYLLEHGANSQALHRELGTAADRSQFTNAPAKETAYLQARTHCANPICINAGLKKCERCLKVYYCRSACIRAHKAECKAAAAKLKPPGDTSSTSSSSTSSTSSSSSSSSSSSTRVFQAASSCH
jgi:ankyrin repeat protein